MLTDTIFNAIDKKMFAAYFVLLDKSKGFDGVIHEMLILKMIDSSCSTLECFHSYLSDRRQVLRVYPSLFEPLSVDSGVPQGRSI